MAKDSLARRFGMFIPTCDICGKGAACHHVKLRLERRDFNVFNVMIYKKTIVVKVCDECQERMEAESSRAFRFGVFSLLAGIVIGCGSIYLLSQFMGEQEKGVQGNALVGVIVLGGLLGVLIAIVARWIFMPNKKDVSYMDTWQMKDLSKDAWRIIGVEE